MRERIVLNNGEYQIVDYEVGNKPNNLVLERPRHSDSTWNAHAEKKYFIAESNVSIKWCRDKYYSFPEFVIAFSEKYQTDIEFVWGNNSTENIVERVLALIKKYKNMDNNKIMEGCIISLKKEIEKLHKNAVESENEKYSRISELTGKIIESSKEIDFLKATVNSKNVELNELRNNTKSAKWTGKIFINNLFPFLSKQK